MTAPQDKPNEDIMTQPKMKFRCATAVATAALITLQAVGSTTLWYDRPATNWEKEALPIGNGRLGAMIFGGIREERIQFNEDSLWTGDENPSGKYAAMGAYQAFGDLYLTLHDARPQYTLSCPSGHLPWQNNPKEAVGMSVDRESETKWCIEHKGRPVQWQVACSEPAVANSYAFTSANDVPQRDPKAWKWEGSADGKTWTLLEQATEQQQFLKRKHTKTYTFENATAYRFYRLTLLENHGATHYQLSEIELGGVTATAPAPNLANYRRTLDIDRAIHTTTYTHEGVRYTREYLSSNPDQVISFRFTADKPGSYSGSIKLTDMHQARITAAGGRITATGALNNGLQYESQVLVLNDGGTLKASGSELIVSGANSLTILLAAGTDYLDSHAKNWRQEHPHKRLTAALDAAATKSWQELVDAHVRDHQSFFRRVSLNAGASSDDRRQLPTDARLKRYKQRPVDPELEVLLFQYGRYLLIASSRPGCLPANLQGLWNNSNNPPWMSDYHSNINVQMNYWASEPANLAECHTPFLKMIYEMRAPSRKATLADSRFNNARGWTVRTSHNPFGGHGWKWNIPGSAWYAQHLWEHYAFGGDETYLRTQAYPVLKEVCEFWEDYLKERPDGTLVVPMGWSPEHGPTEDGVSYDQQIVYDLFTNYMDAATALGIDETYRETVAEMRERLLKPKIGKWGQLQEWETDRDDPNNHHRHVSHLFALHPGRQIAPASTPELVQAANVSLTARGDGGTGWSKAWKISFWARLLDGDHAHKMLSELLQHNIMPNFYDTHPPFQIDGNFGATAGVCEMLVHSHLGEIHLLPSLPKAWLSGSVTGLRARGGFEVDMQWRDGVLIQATIRADKDTTCRLRTNAPVAISHRGKTITASQVEDGLIAFPVTAGQETNVRPLQR